MSVQSHFYANRAEEARRLAEGEVLQNVREGHLRAAAAWDALAARSERSDRLRGAEEVRKAAIRAE